MTEEYKGLHVFWIEQWSQFTSKNNWNIFNIINFEFEDDRIMGGLEATFIILGLGARIRFNYKVTEEVSYIQRQITEIDTEGFTGIETDWGHIPVSWYVKGEKVNKETYEAHIKQKKEG